jgi:hypothetical protein
LTIAAQKVFFKAQKPGWTFRAGELRRKAKVQPPRLDGTKKETEVSELFGLYQKAL